MGMGIGSLCSKRIGGGGGGVEGRHPLGLTPELSVTCSAESKTNNQTATVYWEENWKGAWG